MAIPLSDLLRIKEQLGFYGAGGGKQTTGEGLANALSGIGQGLNSTAQGINTGMDIYNRGLGIQKTKMEQAPVGNMFGVTDQATGDAFSKQHHGLSPNTPTFQAPQAKEIASLDDSGKNVYVNPTNESDISSTKDILHSVELPAHYAMQNVLKAQMMKNTQEINQAKNDLMNAKTQQQADFMKQRIDLLGQTLDLNRQKMEQMAATAAANTVQRASTAAEKEDQGHWYSPIKNLINGGAPTPKDYLNSAAQNAPSQAPTVGGMFNGEKVLNVKRIQ